MSEHFKYIHFVSKLDKIGWVVTSKAKDKSNWYSLPALSCSESDLVANLQKIIWTGEYDSNWDSLSLLQSFGYASVQTIKQYYKLPNSSRTPYNSKAFAEKIGSYLRYLRTRKEFKDPQMLKNELEIVKLISKTVKKQHSIRQKENNSRNSVHNIPTSVPNTAQIHPHCGTNKNPSDDESGGSDSDTD